MSSTERPYDHQRGYYKLQKTFEGAIELQNMDGMY